MSKEENRLRIERARAQKEVGKLSDDLAGISDKKEGLEDFHEFLSDIAEEQGIENEPEVSSIDEILDDGTERRLRREAMDISVSDDPVDIDRIAKLLAKEDPAADEELAEIGSRSIDTRRLKLLVAASRRNGFNRTIPDELLDQLDSSGTHVITPLMWHYYANAEPVRRHVRAQVYLKLRTHSADDPEIIMADFEENAVRRLRRVRPERRTKPNPLWQEVLQMQSDMVEQVQRMPPAIGVANRERPEEAGIMPLPMAAVRVHDPYFANEEAVTLVEFAAATMVSHQLARDDVLTPTGFLVLERPFFVDTPTFGEVPIRAFTWRPTQEGIGVVAFFDLWHPDAPTNEIDSGTLASYRARLWPAMHWDWPWNQSVDGVLTWQNATEEARTALLDLRKFIMSFWLLSQQRVTLVSGQHPPRGFRREAERKGLPSTVLVITLRRRAQNKALDDGQEPRHIEWSHRWIVSGHWRHYDRPEGVKLTWIAPYPKGPEDKPLVLKKKLYNFKR